MRLLPTGRVRGGGGGVHSRAGSDPAPPGPPVTRLFAPGERALLLDSKGRRYLITLAEGASFHSHAGFFAHDDLIG
ncbi:MAG: hypothetical protein ACYCSJ_08610, partial [Acidimicrobiales bacterium]